MRRILVAGILATITVSVCASEPEVLGWAQMIPEDQLQPLPALPGAEPGIFPGPADDRTLDWASPDMFWGGRPVPELDGRFVRLPGYVVPLESDEGGLLDEFLFVPYAGACIHVPPPPPNQIVYVRLEKPYDFRNLWSPYWIIGKIRTTTYIGEIAESVYQMRDARIEKYGQ